MSDQNYDLDELEDRYRRTLREEALVTSGDLRLEVARVLDRSIAGEENVLLHSRHSRFRCPLNISRESRTRVVNGSYDHHTSRADIIRLEGSLTETVEGPVVQHASQEAEHILGGVYFGTWVGPFMRTVAYADFLAWGGWADVDATRIEIGGLVIRAYMAFVGLVGMRIFQSTSLIDDWQMRTETFGTFIDNQADATFLGGPGAGTQLHT